MKQEWDQLYSQLNHEEKCQEVEKKKPGFQRSSDLTYINTAQQKIEEINEQIELAIKQGKSKR